MKKFLVLVLIFLSVNSFAQPFNNEWIDYNKTYYKFKIGSTGLYRIPQSALAAAGLGNADAAQMQLWRNGAQVPIYTTVNTGAIDANGYIEFWGEANDGKPDNPLYHNSNDQLNDKYSFFSDSATYFLTLNSGNNARLQTVANTIPAGATPEPFFMYTAGIYFKDAFHLGMPYGSGAEAVYPSSIEMGEGYTSGDIGNNAVYNTSLSNLFVYNNATAPASTFKINVVGNAANARTAVVGINGSAVISQAFSDYNYAKMVQNFATSLIAGNTANISVTNSTTATGYDRMRMAMIEINYPRQFNFGNATSFRFSLDAKPAGAYLEITGFNATGTPVLYDVANGKRYTTDASTPGVVKVYLQPTTTRQDLVLANNAATNIAGIMPRNFINYGAAANQGDYLIITHNNLLKNSTGANPVEDYRAYRSSAAGGSYNAKIYMVDQLYDQFAYGIAYHTLAIRNFLRYARATYANPVKFALFAGKGVTYNLSKPYENNTTYIQENLVPTFGVPASDILLAAEGGSSKPLTSVGRLAIINGDELTLYLNKIKEYEKWYTPTASIAENLWKKNVAHMVGASDQPTIDMLYSYLTRDKAVIQDTFYGAKVHDFVKSADNATQLAGAERLSNLFSTGMNLLTYFGHSSTTVLGYNMEAPENYNNKGKYPLFNMMGCTVGDIFQLTDVRLGSLNTISEKYVLAKDRGAIGMMAGTSLGYVYPLQDWSNTFYKNLSQKNYGKPIGDQMRFTINDIYSRISENNLSYRIQTEEYTLHGDPAIKLYQQDKPDYAIEDPLVIVNPDFVSVAQSYFNIHALFVNLGKAVNGKLVIELKRTMPDNSTSVIKRDTINAIKNVDSLDYKIAIDPVKDKGNNKITITIDPDNQYNELFETNNSVTKNVVIYEDELIPVYPYKYAIINKQNITFSASTANPLAASRNYLFEIDTTALFNSPLKITANKTSTGGLIEFAPNVSFRDSTVYYWRVASQPAVAGGVTKWNTSSFIYMNGNAVGYNQSHYYQFLNDSYSGLYLDTTRKFIYDPIRTSISINTGIYDYATQASAWQLSVGEIVYQKGWSYSWLDGNTIRFYVIDNKTMQPVYNKDLGTSGMYGSIRPLGFNGSAIPGFFAFDISTINGRKNVMNFLDSIPVNYYIALANSPFGTGSLPVSWQADAASLGAGNTLYDKLTGMGLSRLGEVTNVPFVFIFQKGNTVPYKQEIASAASEILSISTTLNGYGLNGSIASPAFGPALKWQQLQWAGAPEENPTQDKTLLSLIGIDSAGNNITLLTGITTAQDTVDISSIDAKKYPYLQMQMQTTDSANRTPHQLKNWRLYYTPVAEGAIAPNLYFVMKDSLEVGEPLNAGVAFKNISAYNFTDSMYVKLTVRDKNNVESVYKIPKQKLLIAGDTIKLNVPIDTRSITGKNQLKIEFNPDNKQPEQTHFNNFLYKDFFVNSDTTNPYMDVTFDGVHILNKDIVSSRPDINIKLTDDAKWLLLNTTDLVKVQLKYPDGSLHDYNFNTDTLVFNAPIAGNNNTATVSFKPTLLTDGNYELIVSAKDQSGNTAGNMQYRVQFQVINKPMISNLLNYPNPFTTSTAFVFTLTGSEVPQNIRIQILTITGKIVREITKAELGPLRIGRNMTEYKWDGTDQYGQQLANGVYIYRVLTNLNGKALDKYTQQGDNTDRYFNKGYGKMYLMR